MMMITSTGSQTIKLLPMVVGRRIARKCTSPVVTRSLSSPSTGHHLVQQPPLRLSRHGKSVSHNAHPHRKHILSNRKAASSRLGKASLANDSMMTGQSSSSAAAGLEAGTGGFASSAQPKFFFFEALEGFLRKSRTIPIPRWITPRHYTITFSEVLGHSSFLLVAISYAVDDFLMLRCIAVAGSTAMLFFTYYHPHGCVMWLPFKWNALFIAINSYRIGKVLWQRYCAETLAEEFKALRENKLPLMDPVAFYKLVRLGTVKSIRQGELLVGQGQKNRYVRVLLEGELGVLRDGKLNYVLEEANFVSEAGLHAGLLIPGSVESCCSIVADTDARVLEWDRTQLIELLERDGNVRRAWQAAVSWDVVRKLKFQRTLISRGRIDDIDAWTKRRNEQTEHRYTAILQNILSQPKLLESRRRELEKYRFIHHIEDDVHIKALAACGWTEEEFETGVKKNLSDMSVQDDAYFHHDLKWYIQDLYERVFG